MPEDNIAFLLFGLQHYHIQIIKRSRNVLLLEKGYTIEIESNQLFKLKYNDEVIAPFNDVEELCHFIKTDMNANK